MRQHNKVVAHIVVLLTVLALIGFAMPLRGSIGRGDTLGIIRVVTMIVSCIVALVVFIKSFRDARRSA